MLIVEIYPDLDSGNGNVRLSKQPTHTAPQVKITDDGMIAQNDKGYRMAKASHGVWEGKWYFEVTILEHTGNCRYFMDLFRIGWSQISGDLQGPCGFDQFSYSYRDSPGTVFHKASGQHEVPTLYNEGYGNFFLSQHAVMF